MTEPTLLVVGGRRRGRPPASVPKERRTLYAPTAYLDRIDQLALKHGVSYNTVLCRVLQKALDMPAISEPNK